VETNALDFLLSDFISYENRIQPRRVGAVSAVLLRVFMYRGDDKSLARPTSRCILFHGENISFDASPVIYINGVNIPPIMIINRIYENQNLL
jgi:hypothetical protein